MLTELIVGAALQAAAPTTIATPTVAPTDYARAELWLCRPGRQDACAINLDASVVEANGRVRIERHRAGAAPAVDCFYVYPTVSTEPGANSDLVVGEDERRVVASQFARFGSVCRTFAPMYRQVTLSALRAAMTGQPMSAANGRLAYDDVRAAFRHYMANDNGGRPFVLIGHSQGSRMLQQIVRDEIDGRPLQARMLSAMLIGSNILVPEGRDVGGSFKHVPLCRSARQTGCVISYVSFRETAPPPANSRFGRTAEPGMRVACTNPAALDGRKEAILDAYLGATGAGLSSRAAGPWTRDGAAVSADFVKVPRLLSGRCVSDANGDYLAVTVNAEPADPRTNEIVGDVLVGGNVLHDWGLHLIDISVAQGDLVSLVRSQSAARPGRRR
jgi:hypothetical protein